MKNKISHEGVIERFTSKGATVRIAQSSACHQCKIASACHSSEVKEKFIDVTGLYEGRYKVGDTVTVLAAESIGMKAVLYAFVMPIVIMLAFIFTTKFMGGSEILMGVVGIASLIPSYLILYLLRNHFEKTIIFYLK